MQLASAVQPRGTLQAGPDGDWIVEPLPVSLVFAAGEGSLPTRHLGR